MNLRPSRWFFALVWAMFIVKGLLYAAVTPLWEGFDEPFHFAYVQSLAAAHQLPEFGEARVGADVAESTAYVPLPDLMPALGAADEKLTYRDYWQMDQARRAGVMEKLRRLEASADTLTPSDVPLYQVQHPPLYYASCVPVYEAMGGLNIVDKVFALRIFSVLLASLCVIAAAVTAREDAPLTRMCAGFVALWPVLYIDVARVGNDSLGVALYSLLFAAMMRFGERPSLARAVAAGVVLGLGLLTKAYFLPAIPAVILYTAYLAFAYRTRSEEPETPNSKLETAILKGGCLLLAIAAVVGGWWYVRSYLLYGSFSGLQESVYHPAMSLVEKMRAAFEVPWTRIVKHLFVSFCWVNGWSLVHLPKPPYFVFVVAFAVAVVGLARGGHTGPPLQEKAYNQTTSTVAEYQQRVVISAACLLFFFLLGVIYHEINAFAVVGLGGGPGGWYLYALVLPISFMTSLGIRGLGPLARPCLVAAFVAIWAVEMYGFVFVLAPYYAGLALPAADGWGLRFMESPSLIFSMQTMTRLLANKPAFISPAALGLLSLAYLALHAGVIRRCASLPKGTS